MIKRKRRPASYADEFRPPDTIPIARRRAHKRFPGDILRFAIVFGGGWLFLTFYGLPAILWEYSYLSPKEHRTDTACVHIRIDGEIFRAAPDAGARRCSLIAFFTTH